MIDNTTSEKIASAFITSSTLEEVALKLSMVGIHVPEDAYSFAKWAFGLTCPHNMLEAKKGYGYVMSGISAGSRPGHKPVRSYLLSDGAVGRTKEMVLDYCRRNCSEILAGDRFWNVINSSIFNRTYLKQWQLAALKAKLSKDSAKRQNGG